MYVDDNKVFKPLTSFLSFLSPLFSCDLIKLPKITFIKISKTCKLNGISKEGYKQRTYFVENITPMFYIICAGKLIDNG